MPNLERHRSKPETRWRTPSQFVSEMANVGVAGPHAKIVRGEGEKLGADIPRAGWVPVTPKKHLAKKRLTRKSEGYNVKKYTLDRGNFPQMNLCRRHNPLFTSTHINIYIHIHNISSKEANNKER